MQMTPEPPSGRRAHEHSPERKPSLLDDIFTNPAEKARKESERRAEVDLSHPPSLVDDVFSSGEPKARKRIPVWLFVIAAIILMIGGSVLVYKSNKSVTPAWKEEPRPKLEMAEPPPVPPLGRSEVKPTEPPQEAPAAPSPTVQAQTAQPPVTKPAKVTRQPETTKPGKAPLSAATGTKPDSKPKLLREPEDLAEEQRAFDLLREKSQAARQLLDGNLEQFRFLEYQVIPKEAGQYWVDLVAAQKDAGRAVHFIWAVNPDKQTTTALSQAARDIDR